MDSCDIQVELVLSAQRAGGPATLEAVVRSENYAPSNSSNALPAASLQPAIANTWHMVTLTSSPTVDNAFSLYLNGTLISTYTEPQASGSAGSGGFPLSFSVPMLLCAEEDAAPDNFFQGRVAHLTIFSGALTRSEVQSLYQTYTAAH